MRSEAMRSTGSEPMKRLFDLYCQTGNETTRAARFKRVRQDKLKSTLAQMSGEEGVIAAIVQPVFATLTQALGKTGDFIPALALNGPHRELAPIVQELLQAFCDYLVATEVEIRAMVASRDNSDGEPCLGLERINYVAEPSIFQW